MQAWIAFDAVEPIGYWRTDYNTAMICAMYANANRKKGSQAFKPLDFMPFMPENKADDIEDVLLKFQALAAATAKATE